MDYIVDSFKTDHPELINLNIQGSIPEWVQGRLYRNGPGQYRFGQDEAGYLFDGMAVIHCYQIQDGEVKYHNRLLDSDTYQKNKAANRIVVTEFGTLGHVDPCKSLFSRYASFFNDALTATDNDNVNLMLLGDQIYAMTETSLMNIVDPDTLERIEKVNWSKYVSVHLATAHPLTDHDGTTYNLGTSLGLLAHYNFVKVPPADKGDPNPVRHTELVGRIPAQWPLMPSYSHSFGMTQNYLILVEQPMAFNLVKVVTGHLLRHTLVESLKFYEDCKTKFHLVHKYSGGLVPITYVSKPFFVFHHINAYEDGQNIIVDLAGYNDGAVIKSTALRNLRDPEKSIPKAFFKRFVLPLPAKKAGDLLKLDYTTASARLLDDGTIYCVPECPPDISIELPGINRLHTGRHYRYVYGFQEHEKGQPKLIKYDIKLRAQSEWYEEGHLPGEPVFVPRPGAMDEDDGVILSPALACKEGLNSFLLVLDARTFKELARAQIPGDIRVPVTFHGLFTETFNSVREQSK